MSSAYTPKWMRILQRITPWMFIECPGHNKHWWHQKRCWCCRYENGQWDYIYHNGEWLPLENPKTFDAKMRDNVQTFNIQCTMKDRWVPQFLGMLSIMEYLGHIGSSRKVTLFSDGDGDFQPKFSWSDNLPAPAESLNKVDPFFDAG